MATGSSSSMYGILSDEETNYLRAAHLIIHICPEAVRKLFDSRHPPPQLTGQLAAKQAILQNCRGIEKRHWPLLFPNLVTTTQPTTAVTTSVPPPSTTVTTSVPPPPTVTSVPQSTNVVAIVPPPSTTVTTSAPPTSTNVAASVPSASTTVTTSVPLPSTIVSTSVPPPSTTVTSVPPPSTTVTTNVPPPSTSVSARVVKSSDFDITLLMALLRNFSGITQPSKGWNTMPAASDQCEGDDLVRIRLYRNAIVHSSEAKLANKDFKILWTELEKAIDRLSGGTMKQKVNDLRYVVLDQTQRELLLKSLQHERILKHHQKEIEEIKQKHGKEIETIKQRHEEEMKRHDKEIAALKQRHEEDMKGHGEEIAAIKQRHEAEMKGYGKEIKEIKHTHKEELEGVKQRHKEEMERHGEEIAAIKERHETEMKIKEEKIRKLEWEQKQTIPHNIRVQHTCTLKEWKKDDMVFYETTGYKGALELLNSKNYITIIASPGAGKSTIAQHIALKMENEGWEVVPIDGVDDLIKYGSFDKKQVFVIDDVVGVFSVDMPQLDAFSKKQKQILNLIQNQTKLIMTCRKVVYNEVQKSKSLLTDFVIDLESSDFKLEDKEKSKILMNHCKAAKISPDLYENIPLSNAKVMFPLLCKIFCSEQKYQEMGKQFFQRPNECLLEKLEYLKERIPLQYAGLILLCLNKKKVLSKTDCESDENFLSLRKTVFDIYDVNHGTPASKIIKALSLLDGTYTRPASDGFTFIHDSIFELVAYHHGQSYPEHILKYSSSSYVNNRVTVDDPPSDGSLYIKLEKKHYSLLAERILDDIRTLKLYDVFKNPILKNSEFLDVFIKILQGTDFKIFKDMFFKSLHGLQEPDTSDESDTSEQRTKDVTDREMWWYIKRLLERGDIRVIRWIVFYGPTRLLEFVINHVKRQEGTQALKRTADGLTGKERTIKLLFGEKEEQTLLLVIGCFSGDVDRVRVILQHVDPSCVNTHVYVWPPYTPLTAACYCGHLPVVDVLIQHHARVDIPDILGNTPLYIASERGHCDIVSLLLDNAADVSISNHRGTSPLQIALYLGKMDVVRMIVKHTNKVRTNEGNNQLYHELIQLKHLEVNEEETSRRGRIVYKGSKRTRLSEGLLEVIRWEECGVMRQLLMLGLDVNHCDERGRSLLCSVIREGVLCKEREEKVKLLLESGADVNIRDNKCVSVTEHTRQRVCKYREDWQYNEYCNVLNVVKCHVRRYSV